MIPAVIPPLTALAVLVTRPLPQADSLAASIASLGGEAIVFPSIAIEPLEVSVPAPHDLVIFVSAHAVEHGARFIQRTTSMRIAAIGKATAAALAAINMPADLVPVANATSEGLLEHPDLKRDLVRTVLIVRGEGGREALRDAFIASGSQVTAFEVYRRVKASVTAADVAALESRWAQGEVDIVTATSVDTYLRLEEILSDQGRALLRQTRLLVPSARIIDAARIAGWNGDALISSGADDHAMVGTLARWRTRARDE